MKRVYIEISNACNLACTFCPGGEDLKSQQWMSLELFEATLDSLDGVTNEVYLHVLGEPLLHPLLGAFLNSCVQRKIQVNLTTNGMRIDSCGAVLQASSAMRQINFSLHALQELPDEACALTAADNILDFVQRLVAARPDIYINLRLWNEGDTQSGELVAWNQKIRELIRKKFDLDFPDFAFSPRTKNRKLRGRIYLNSDTLFEWPSQSQNAPARTGGSCVALDTHCAVLVDGRVVACCLDCTGALEIGHVSDGGVSAALKLPRALAMRQGFDDKQLVESFCQHCQFSKRFGS